LEQSGLVTKAQAMIGKVWRNVWEEAVTATLLRIAQNVRRIGPPLFASRQTNFVAQPALPVGTGFRPNPLDFVSVGEASVKILVLRVYIVQRCFVISKACFLKLIV